MNLIRAGSLAAVALVAGAALSGCGQTHRVAPVAAAAPIGQLPRHVFGYRVQPEDVRKRLAAAGKQAYVTGIKLWTLREGSYLRAAVEVARFAPDAPVQDAGFRADTVSGIGVSQALTRYVGGHDVFVTTGDRQVFYVWFRGRDMLILTIPQTTPQPRALLRYLLRTAHP